MIGRGRNLSEVRNQLTYPVRSTTPQRLDHYLLATLDWKSRTRIQKLIRDGYITVNSEEAKPSRRVVHGDVITVKLSLGTGVPESFEERTFDVLYEDLWLVVVNKPPDLLVHPVGRHVYDTFINYMHHIYRNEKTVEGQPVVPRLCHRLDRDTTGVLVVAKDPHVHRQVQYQFEKRLVKKEYYTLVRGALSGGAPSGGVLFAAGKQEACVDMPIGEGRCLRSCLEHPALKPSRTDIRLVETYGRENDSYSLLACLPHTGRQNQIRVHLAATGCGIVGDQRYGNVQAPADFPERYLLHARKLQFYHPRWKSNMEITAPLPKDFRNILNRLRAVEVRG